MKRICVFFLPFLSVLFLISFSVSENVKKVRNTEPNVTDTTKKTKEPSILYDWSNRKRPIPDEKVFQTKYLGGTQIVFNHKLHEKDLKIQCIECHHVESCEHCHKKEVTRWDVQESKVVLHENCFVCHSDKSCTACHKK